MNAISARQNASGPIAASMNGLRRPIGVWNVSLQGPITSGSVSANAPSAPSTRPINPVESVKRCSNRGRNVAVVVRENARPKAPSPSVQTRRRSVLRSSGADGRTCTEASAHDVEDRLLRQRDLCVAVRKLSQHPAREELLEAAVDDPA